MTRIGLWITQPYYNRIGRGDAPTDDASTAVRTFVVKPALDTVSV